MRVRRAGRRSGQRVSSGTSSVRYVAVISLSERVTGPGGDTAELSSLRTAHVPQRGTRRVCARVRPLGTSLHLTHT